METRTPHRTVAMCEQCGRLEDASLLLAVRREEETDHRLAHHPEWPASFKMLASVLGAPQDRRIK